MQERERVHALIPCSLPASLAHPPKWSAVMCAVNTFLGAKAELLQQGVLVDASEDSPFTATSMAGLPEEAHTATPSFASSAQCMRAKPGTATPHAHAPSTCCMPSAASHRASCGGKAGDGGGVVDEGDEGREGGEGEDRSSHSLLRLSGRDPLEDAHRMQLAAAERLMHEHEDSESQARTGPKRAAAATAAATASRPSPRASPRVMPRMSPRAMSLASPRSLPSPHTLPPPRSPAVPPGRSPDAAAASAELALSSCSDDPGLRSDDDMTHGRGPDACAARASPPPRKPIHFRSTE